MGTSTISQLPGLPSGQSILVGTELLEIQNGAGAGASQQITANLVAQIALRQSVQSISGKAGSGVLIDNTNPNAPVINIPKAVNGTYISIDYTNIEAPVINCTIPVDGGIQAAYGSPGGSVIQTAASVTGLATAAYQLNSWALQCYPSGSISLDFQVGTLGSPPSSIIGSGGNYPTISSNVSASANIGGWVTNQVTQGQVIAVVVRSVVNVQWFSLALYGIRK